MQRIANWLLWTVVFIIVVLAGLNWGTLTTPAPINLLVMRIDAPLGIIMFGLTGILIALSFIATLRNQIGALMENKRLNKEIHRLQGDENKRISDELAALRKLVEAQRGKSPEPQAATHLPTPPATQTGS